MSGHPQNQTWPEAQPRRGGMPWWGWTLLGTGLFIVVSCVGILSFLVYLGSVAPDTKVYAGNRVPARFAEIMRDVGALEDGERIDYFYSDAFMNIRRGFYFVSDRGVVIYSDDLATPLQRATFDQIIDATISRDNSFFFDSEIALVLIDGTVLCLPVSSEDDGDVRFLDTIRSRMSGEAGR